MFRILCRAMGLNIMFLYPNGRKNCFLKYRFRLGLTGQHWSYHIGTYGVVQDNGFLRQHGISRVSGPAEEGRAYPQGCNARFQERCREATNFSILLKYLPKPGSINPINIWLVNTEEIFKIWDNHLCVLKITT